MKKAILAVQRVNNSMEIDILRLKNSVIESATGLKHYLDVEDVVGGGHVVTVYVDDSVVESGEYMTKMLLGLARIEAACQEAERDFRAADRLDRVEPLLNTPAGDAAGAQVKSFFGL
jgi:hypothetical protein